MEVARDKVGTVGAEDWVPAERYEEAVERSRQFKAFALSTFEDDEERAQIAAHWPFDIMDEEDYL